MRVLISILFFFTFARLALSQDPGYLITTSGDTLHGNIELVSFEFAFQEEPDFVIYQEDGTMLRFLNQLISEYGLFAADPISGRRQWVHYYAQVKGHLREFLKPYLDGRARLYADFKNAWYAKIAPDEFNRKNRALIYHLALAGEEKLITLSKDNFIEITKEKFQNCPELVKQIGDKYFEFDNIEGIVSYYNRLCSAQ